MFAKSHSPDCHYDVKCFLDSQACVLMFFPSVKTCQVSAFQPQNFTIYKLNQPLMVYMYRVSYIAARHTDTLQSIITALPLLEHDVPHLMWKLHH